MNLPVGNRLARNSLLTIISKGIEAGGSFAATFIVARYLGRSGYGLYAEIVSTIMLLWPLVDMGLDQLMVRELVSGRERAGTLLGTSAVVRLLAALCATAFLAIWLMISHASGHYVLAAAIVAANILFLRQASNLICRAMFLGLERVERDIAATAVGQCIRVSGLLVVSRADLGFHAILIVPVVAEAVQISLGLLLARNYLGNLHLMARRILALCLLREGWPLLVRLVLVTAYFHVDNVLLGRLLSSEELGLFAAPFRIVVGLIVAVVPAMWAFLPSLTRRGAEGANIMSRAALIAASVSVVLGFGLAVPAEALITGTLGHGFSCPTSVIILRLLALLPALHALSYLMELELLASGRQQLALWGAGPALVIKIGLDLALWASLGPVVGAVSSLAADVVRITLLSQWAGKGWLPRSLVPVVLLAATVVFLLVHGR